MPTPVPTPNAIISDCSGKARDTAVRAFSLMRDTKILSIILYNACTSIEIIIGSDILIKSRLTGMAPILFSCVFSIVSISFLLHNRFFKTAVTSSLTRNHRVYHHIKWNFRR